MPTEHEAQDKAAVQRPNLLAGEQLPPPARQERSRQKRDALLQAALELFAQHGYEATSIEDIAQRSAVAVGSFYQHFASKRQVLLVLMERMLAEAASLTRTAGNANLGTVETAIKQLVRQGLQVDWAYAGASRAWHEAAVLDSTLGRLHQEVEHWTAGELAIILRILLKAPGARLLPEIDTLAWVLSLLFWRLAETELPDAETVIEAVSLLIYHALFSD